MSVLQVLWLLLLQSEESTEEQELSLFFMTARQFSCCEKNPGFFIFLEEKETLEHKSREKKYRKAAYGEKVFKWKHSQALSYSFFLDKPSRAQPMGYSPVYHPQCLGCPHHKRPGVWCWQPKPEVGKEKIKSEIHEVRRPPCLEGRQICFGQNPCRNVFSVACCWWTQCCYSSNIYSFSWQDFSWYPLLSNSN